MYHVLVLCFAQYYYTYFLQVVVGAEPYLTDMQAVLEDNLPPVLENPTAGMLCVTRWRELMYRAVIVWVCRDYCKVRFIDYGNCWYTSLSDLLNCPIAYRGPGFAVPIDVKMDDNSVITTNKIYQVEKTEGAVSVTIPGRRTVYNYTKPKIGARFNGFILIQKEHGRFFLGSSKTDLEAVAVSIGAAVTAKRLVPNLVQGTPVIALYEGDWYRGRVEEVIDSNSANVFFVDYGNSAICTSMFDVSPDVMAHPVAGVDCKMKGVQWVGVEAQPIYDEHVVADAKVTIIASSYCKDKNQFTVKLLTGKNFDVNAAILSATVSQKTYSARDYTTHLPPDNTLKPSYCSTFNSVQDLCLQLEEDTVTLQIIAAETEAAPKITLLPHLAKPNSACLVKNPTDGMYHRAVITSLPTPDTFTLLHVDYGNRTTVHLHNLFDIPASLVKNHKMCGILAAVAQTTDYLSCSLNDETPTFDPIKTAQLEALCNSGQKLLVSVEGIAPDNEHLLVNIVGVDEPRRNAVEPEARLKPATTLPEPPEILYTVVSGVVDKYFFLRLNIINILTYNKLTSKIIFQKLFSNYSKAMVLIIITESFV